MKGNIVMTIEDVKTVLKNAVIAHPIGYSRHIQTKCKSVFDFICKMQFFDDRISLKTKIYCIINDCISTPPKCAREGCHHDVPHEIESIAKGFQKYCSIKCGNSDPAKLQRVSDTCVSKYGVKNVFQSAQVQNAIAKTKLIKHGDPYWNNAEQTKCTIRKHIDEDPEYYAKIHQKQMDTNVKNGHAPTWSNAQKAKETWEAHKMKDPNASAMKVHRSKMSKLKNHNDPNWNNPDKTKHTKTVRYGNSNYNNLQKAKQTKKMHFGNEKFNNHVKYVQTCLDKYGVQTTFLSHEIMKNAKYPYRYDGKTFKSSPELAYYIYLTDNGIDFIFQPKQCFTYQCRGKQFRYFPDFFICNENAFHEIKGNQFFLDSDPSKNMINPFDRNQDDIYEAKHQCMLENNVKIITTDQYHVFLKYVADKYGKDFIRSLKTKKHDLQATKVNKINQ